MNTRKQLLFALFAILVFAACSKTEDKKTGWSEYDLKGKVQNLCIKDYAAEMAFGELTKGTLKDSIIVSFSEEGKVLQVLYYSFKDEKAETITKTIMSYAGNSTTIDRYENDTLSRKIICTYTDFGEIEKEISYDSNGKMIWKEDYTYNEKEKLEEKNVFDDEGLWRKWKDYEYNDKGLVKKVKKYNNRGKLVEIEFYKYDEQGRLIKNKEEDEDGNVESTISYSFNKEGFVSTYTYDCKYFNHKYEHSYEYDKMGNFVIMRTIGPNDNSIQERTIKYF